ncbi:MAG: dephospho-CoA kinase [Lachnospiraceae bacterium]|nr:dephospho-CoA kinase [Lachnospiraceae bacterium]
MVLGIVGKIGSGKSTAIEYIKKNYDAIVFSCDEIAKDIIEKGETDYEPGFAGEIFINEKKQEECRTILHPLVFRRIYGNICKIMNENNFNNISNKNNRNAKKTEKLENNKGLFEPSRIKENFKNKNNLILIESALPSDEMYKMCDKVIYIDSSFEDRVKRLKESRDYSEAKTKLIYNSQEYYEKYYNMADYKIYNNGTKEELEEKVKEVLDEIYITCK